MSAVYNLRSHKLDDFIVTKFDDDFNIESYYEMTVSDGIVRCGCPAGARPSCRHRAMFTQLLERLDTAWFLDFDTRAWVDPTGEAALSKPGPEPHPRAEAQSMQGAIDSGAIKFVEEQAAPEPIISLPDTHPFRRRL